MSTPTEYTGMIIEYTNQVVWETDFLRTNLYAQTGINALSNAVLNTGQTTPNAAIVAGMACAPVSPPGLQVVVGPGCLFNIQNLFPQAYGVYGVDTNANHNQYKECINFNPATLNTAAPVGGGNSVYHLIEVIDTLTLANPVSRPYYNSAAPASPIFTTEPDTYVDLPSFVVKTGTPGVSPTPPTPDAGYTPLYLVLVANGQTSISSGNITVAPNAPFLTEGLTNKISAATAAGLFSPLAYRNGVINGNMIVTQRSAATIVINTGVYGKVDAMLVTVSGSSVSAGTADAASGLSYGSTGTALYINGLTCSGCVVTTSHFIESLDSLVFINQTASVSCIVYQNTGSALNYHIQIAYANSTNSFGSQTQVSISSPISVPSGVATLINFNGINMGSNIANGIAINILTDNITVTTKDFYITDLELNLGATAVPFQPEEYQATRAKCLRRYEQSYEDGIATGAVTAIGVWAGNSTGTAIGSFLITIPLTAKINIPIITYYNPFTGSAGSGRGGDNANYAIQTTDQGHKSFLTSNSVAGPALEENISFHWTASADL